jgi:hypothetical protein
VTAGFDDGPSRSSVEHAVHELQRSVEAALAVDGELNERVVVPAEARPVTIEQVEVDVRGLEAGPDVGLQRVKCRRVAADLAPCRADETVPHTPAPALVREADLLGVPEAARVVQEHPQGSSVPARQVVEFKAA